VYLRFQAILGRLLASREEIPQRQAARVKADEVARGKWLSAEATYQLAKIDIKTAQASEGYAQSMERKWGYAFAASQGNVHRMVTRMQKKWNQLLDERLLILEILEKLQSAKLSGREAMGMVQNSLAECAACNAWRAVAPTWRASAATTFALASSLEGGEVKSILEEILDDLNARRALYEQMLSRARIDVYDNEKKLNKWAAEVSVMAARVYADEKKIQEFSHQSLQLAGELRGAEEAESQGEQFMSDQLHLTARHCEAIRRILRGVAASLEKCPGGAPKELYPPLAPPSLYHQSPHPPPAATSPMAAAASPGEKPARLSSNEKGEMDAQQVALGSGRGREGGKEAGRKGGREAGREGGKATGAASSDSEINKKGTMDFTKFMTQYRATLKREKEYNRRMKIRITDVKQDEVEVAKLRADAAKDSPSSALLKVAQVLGSVRAPSSMYTDV